MTALTPDDIAAARRLRGGTAWHVVSSIADAVALEAGLRAGEIMGRDRHALVSEARQIVMFAAHKRGVSVPDIARALCRDVSTVRHGIDAEAKRRGWKA